MASIEIHLTDGTVVRPADLFDWNYVHGQPAIVLEYKTCAVMYPFSSIKRVVEYKK